MNYTKPLHIDSISQNLPDGALRDGNRPDTNPPDGALRNGSRPGANQTDGALRNGSQPGANRTDGALRAPVPRVLLGNTGLSVSRAGFGVLPMGPAQLALPLEEGARLISYAMDCGINFFDTAQYYRTYPYLRLALQHRDQAPSSRSATSEWSEPAGCPKPAGPEHASEWSDPAGRPEPVICSKSLAADYDGMMAAIEEARRALDRDVIDIFLMHEVRTGQLPQRARAWEALQDARARGWIRACGLSTHHVNVAAAAAQMRELDVVFPLLNYAGLGIRTCDETSQVGEVGGAGGAGGTAQLGGIDRTGRPAERFATAEEMMEAIRLCRRAGKGVFTMKAFGGGSLTATYRQALDYVFGQPEVDAVMIGFGRISEIDDLVSYLSGSMAPSYQPDVSHKRIHINQEDCEGCGACRAACPAGAIFWNGSGLAEVDPDCCLTCGYCTPVCPVRAVIMY
ncbi:MAG: aldo/keto reductase [Anaerovoracaceae bacterium]